MKATFDGGDLSLDAIPQHRIDSDVTLAKRQRRFVQTGGTAESLTNESVVPTLLREIWAVHKNLRTRNRKAVSQK